MISVDFIKNDMRLVFALDRPLPLSVQKDNQEFRSFIDRLKGAARLNIQRNSDNSIACLSADMEGWIRFIRDSLPPAKASFHQKTLEMLPKNDFKASDDGLSVNFHQRSFDTDERYWSFILNQGNFMEYFLNRLDWHLFPKYSIVAPFPLHVDLETSNTCNMNCPMCYREQIKESGHMPGGIFKKAIDECASNNVFSVRLSWRGEALTHPDIKAMINYAASKIKNTSFLTNAFYLDEGIMDCLIDNKVSYVSVSFDGVEDTYEAIRRPADFKESYNRLALFQKKKKAANSKFPQVRICTLWPAIKDNPDKYYRIMNEVSDYIVCNPYINFKGEMKIKPNFICQYPWERIVIAFNGYAQCCTGWNADDIILGNINNNSIFDMWHSDLMDRVRNLHSQGRRMELDSCANCRHGSTGDPNVNIREILNRGF